MVNNYLILVAGFLISIVIRTGYELLKEAGKIKPENKLVVSIIFLVMFTLWACWFDMCQVDPWQLSLPQVVQWSGFLLFIIGLLLAFGSLIQLRGVENIRHLVTTGLFTKMRHPMYTGFNLWIIGWSMFHGAILSLAIGIIGIANIFYWKKLEEARLNVQFGDHYRQYRATTWF